jgi:hypothetical protein
MANAPFRWQMRCVRGAFVASLLSCPSLSIARDAGPATIPIEQLPDAVRAQIGTVDVGRRREVHYEHNSDLPPRIVGGDAPPLHELVVKAIALEPAAGQILELSRVVLQNPRVLEVIKRPERVEFLGGGVVFNEKDDDGVETPSSTYRLKYFSHEIRRVVVVHAARDGEVRDVRIRDAGYQAPLTREEVQRAERIARASPGAPRELARYTIARALVVPPDDDAARVAYVMFRDAESRVWHYEAFVDLTREEVRQLNPIL